MSDTNETLLKTENKQEATEIIEFLGELRMDEKKQFINFISGIRFAKTLHNLNQS